MPGNPENPTRQKIFGKGIGLALVLAAAAAGFGYVNALRSDPSGWSNLPYTLEGALYGWGLGLGIGGWLALPQPLRTPKNFNRLFFSVLTAFFAVIYLSEPLHLDFWPVLPYLLLVVVPLLAMWWALSTLCKDGKCV